MDETTIIAALVVLVVGLVVSHKIIFQDLLPIKRKPRSVFSF